MLCLIYSRCLRNVCRKDKRKEGNIMYVWAMRFGDKSLRKPEYVYGVEFRTARMTRKLLHILELENIIKTFENEF